MKKCGVTELKRGERFVVLFVSLLSFSLAVTIYLLAVSRFNGILWWWNLFSMRAFVGSLEM